MEIPWAKPYIGDEELREVVDTFKSTWLSMGPKVEKFEQIISEFVGVKHCIAVNSGTAALDVALKILEIKPDDEVIVPAFTYIATANSVLYQHAVPIFADVDAKTYTLNPDDVVRKITSKTRCLLPVDYAGQTADFDSLAEIAINHGLYIVEDAAPGFGGEYKGKKLCSFGDVGITSFHMAKIFTTVEGGMVFTDDDELAKRARIIRSQGENPDQKYHHPLLGHNYRMTDINAAIGLAQISRMEGVMESRRQAAEYYIKCFQDYKDIVLPFVKAECSHAWFLFPVLIENREEVRAFLTEKGIGTNISWPMPVYEQEPFKKFKQDSCPVAEEICRKILCLPMFYNITKEEQNYVIENLIKAVKISKEKGG